ncbi:MAG: hypothetical protein JRN02_07085 [Nitrososphaerota archaeon]|nr:hypothetical protein [Nitrososphaerota archaeon]
MIVEDLRNVTCGDDPLTYLRNTMKLLYFECAPGQEANLLLMKSRFPYERPVFESLASINKLEMLNFIEQNGEISVHLKRMGSN